MRKKPVPLSALGQQFEDLSVEMFRRFKQMSLVGMEVANKAFDAGDLALEK